MDTDRAATPRAACDALVLGAGASGMMCAAKAAAGGAAVLLLDHGDAPGRKLNVTGGGKGNFSNRRISPADYYGENPDFCRSALSRFGPDEALAMLRGAGIAVEEREHGQLFCLRSAKELTNLLRRECERHGCVFMLGVKVKALRRASAPGDAPGDAPGAAHGDAFGPRAARFVAETSAGPIAARSVVIATGGPAWPQVGATGSGFELARSMGHAVIPPRPALVGLVMEEGWPLAGLEGISAPVSIRLKLREQKTTPPKGARGGRRKAAPFPDPVADSLPLLFTHKGVSGPAALQASLYWRPGMGLSIDFLPGSGSEGLFDTPGAGRAQCASLLRRHLPERLVKALLPPDLAVRQVAQLSRPERDRLWACLHAFEAVPSATEGFQKAEVAAGGVSTDSISSRSMQSALVPGLYFCGEVLDVTGRLGGYNLHWAFASGLAAGEDLARSPREEI